MMRILKVQAVLVLTLALLGAGCAGRSAEGPSPAPSGRPTGPLVPSEAALRTADRVQLTGTELGTMWTFENPPLEYWRATYGFEATPEWLTKVRLASVRFGEICSASFVSPDGLVMTNHHCARRCVEAVSTAEVDYLIEGFYAPRRQDELVCPNLYLDQLVEIEDVTERVRRAAPAGAPETEITAAQQAEREAIRNECEAATDYTCQVVSLFHGGQYKLYKYRRFEPVKLVFAPELQAGFYGGDPDNFTYPRYALDVAFVRAYEPGGRTPARTPNYFSWDTDGAQEGELVFVTGNPGGTSRQITVSQALYEERFRHPFLINYLEEQRDLLQWIARLGPEAERGVRDQLFSVENSIKAFSGQYAGLQDTLLMGRKIRWERELRQRVEADPALDRQYGDVWDRMNEIQNEKLVVAPRINIYNIDFLGDPYTSLAGGVVRYVRESARPEAERLEGYSDAELAERAQALQSPSQVNEELAARMLAVRLRLAQRWLPQDDPFLREAIRPGETAEQAATRLVRDSRVADASFRTQLLQGGVQAVEASNDPMIRLALLMERNYRELQPRWVELQARESVQGERLAGALFAVYGTDLPPDATFTLRITDGVVAGYPYNGTMAPYKTTFWGMFDRAYSFDNRMPWTIPETFRRRVDALNLSAPVNFVTTNDITGGNSGSPIIDRNARVVGLAFDSNIEGLPNEFLFRTETGGRTVAVHSAGILEALRSVYQTEALVNELLGRGNR